MHPVRTLSDLDIAYLTKTLRILSIGSQSNISQKSEQVSNYQAVTQLAVEFNEFVKPNNNQK
jgi:hypothetical protein